MSHRKFVRKGPVNPKKNSESDDRRKSVSAAALALATALVGALTPLAYQKIFAPKKQVILASPDVPNLIPASNRKLPHSKAQFDFLIRIANIGDEDAKSVAVSIEAPEGIALGEPSIETVPHGFEHLRRPKEQKVSACPEVRLLTFPVIGKGETVVIHLRGWSDVREFERASLKVAFGAEMLASKPHGITTAASAAEVLTTLDAGAVKVDGTFPSALRTMIADAELAPFGLDSLVKASFDPAREDHFAHYKLAAFSPDGACVDAFEDDCAQFVPSGLRVFNALTANAILPAPLQVTIVSPQVSTLTISSSVTLLESTEDRPVNLASRRRVSGPLQDFDSVMQ
jgi:hypothetical protein